MTLRMEGPFFYDQRPLRLRRLLAEVALGVGIAVVATVLASAVFKTTDMADIMMVYLLGVVIISTRVRPAGAVVASVVNVTTFFYFFIPPYRTWTILEPRHLWTTMVLLIVAVLTSALTSRLRTQTEMTEKREKRTVALYSLSHDLSVGRTEGELCDIAVRHVAETFKSRAIVLRPADGGGLTPKSSSGTDGYEPDDAGWTAARKAMATGQPAGRGVMLDSPARALYLPLAGMRGVLGVIGVLAPPGLDLEDPEPRQFLQAFAALTATAIERALLGESAQKAKLQVEAEQLKNSLLSSVSHDLRTPLGAITGAASALLERDASFDATSKDLIATVLEEAEHLNRVVSNLLDMTRLESGRVQLHKEWQPVEEVVGAALTRVEARLDRRPVKTHVPDDLPLVLLDSVLIGQVLINLLENAIKYTPPASPLTVSAVRETDHVLFEVKDEGPGIPATEMDRVFEKFHCLKHPGVPAGVGLGLAICRAVVEAHGGHIWVENCSPGAVFRFTIPVSDPPPDLAMAAGQLQADQHGG
jgi:two-component system, OmpR family, sensor histidine kinase KdpD